MKKVLISLSLAVLAKGDVASNANAVAQKSWVNFVKPTLQNTAAVMKQAIALATDTENSGDRRLQLDMGTENMPEFMQQCMTTHLNIGEVQVVMTQMMTNPMSLMATSQCSDPIGGMLEPLVSVFTKMNFKGFMQCIMDEMFASPCGDGETALEMKFMVQLDMDTSEVDKMKTDMEASFSIDDLNTQLEGMGFDLSTISDDCKAQNLINKLLSSLTGMFDAMDFFTMKISWCQLSNDDCWTTGGLNLGAIDEVNTLMDDSTSMFGDGSESFSPGEFQALAGQTSMKIDCVDGGESVQITAYSGTECTTPYPASDQLPSVPKTDFKDMFDPDKMAALLFCEDVPDAGEVCYAMALGFAKDNIDSIGSGECLSEVNNIVKNTVSYSTRVAERAEDDSNMVAVFSQGSGDGSNAAASVTAFSFLVAFFAYMMN